MENVKKIPYGMTNFTAIIRDNYYYVDKTRYIKEIENVARFFFIVRPRRFGKSLFLNMLSKYYDRYETENFEELFGGLYIGSHPTENRNKYLVMKLNFSTISADPKRMLESFNDYCSVEFLAFVEKYIKLLGQDTLDELRANRATMSASSMLNRICTAAKKNSLQLYLILDEYDNFANNILVSYGNGMYRDLTHGSGFLREFLKVVKVHTESVIDRIYITGVSPVTMDDLTSGFNIADNYSTDPRFNNMIGFNKQEVRDMLDYYQAQGRLLQPVDELLQMMKPWYDNYCFSGKALHEPSMYNADMVLYFVNRYLGNQTPPEQMIDTNCRTDYNKLRHLLHVDKSFGSNASIIQEIVTKGSTVGTIATSFPAENIVKPENFKSLLYYYGMLSISKSQGTKTMLSIPNQVVREQLYNYLIEIYNDTAELGMNIAKLDELMYFMAYEGNWEDYFHFITTELDSHSSIREFIEGEAHVKGFMLAYMGMNGYYITRPEYESNKGFADFFMQPNLLLLPDMKYSYAIEIKYCKRGSTETEVEQLKIEARKQLRQYVSKEWIQHDKGTTELTAIALVFRGWKLESFEKIV